MWFQKTKPLYVSELLVLRNQYTIPSLTFSVFMLLFKVKKKRITEK